jgi:hypothetical protein
MIRNTFQSVRARAAVGTVLATAVLVVLSGIGAQGASASRYRSASESQFCSTIISYHPTAVPSATNLKSYRAWATTLIPFYSKLASEAPNAATKSVLNEVVVVLKYYSNSSSIAKLDASVVKYHAKWLAGSKALANAVVACVKTLE